MIDDRNDLSLLDFTCVCRDTIIHFMNFYNSVVKDPKYDSSIIEDLKNVDINEDTLSDFGSFFQDELMKILHLYPNANGILTLIKNKKTILMLVDDNIAWMDFDEFAKANCLKNFNYVLGSLGEFYTSKDVH